MVVVAVGSSGRDGKGGDSGGGSSTSSCVMMVHYGLRVPSQKTSSAVVQESNQWDAVWTQRCVCSEHHPAFCQGHLHPSLSRQANPQYRRRSESRV